MWLLLVDKNIISIYTDICNLKICTGDTSVTPLVVGDEGREGEWAHDCI